MKPALELQQWAQQSFILIISRHPHLETSSWNQIKSVERETLLLLFVFFLIGNFFLSFFFFLFPLEINPLSLGPRDRKSCSSQKFFLLQKCNARYYRQIDSNQCKVVDDDPVSMSTNSFPPHPNLLKLINVFYVTCYATNLSSVGYTGTLAF